MTSRNRGEPAGLSKLAAPVPAPAMRRTNRKDSGRLERILEPQQARAREAVS